MSAVGQESGDRGARISLVLRQRVLDGTVVGAIGWAIIWFALCWKLHGYLLSEVMSRVREALICSYYVLIFKSVKQFAVGIKYVRFASFGRRGHIPALRNLSYYIQLLDVSRTTIVLNLCHEIFSHLS